MTENDIKGWQAAAHELVRRANDKKRTPQEQEKDTAEATVLVISVAAGILTSLCRIAERLEMIATKTP